MTRRQPGSEGALERRQIRLSEADVALLDRLAAVISPEVPIGRSAVIRLAIRELAERRLTRPARRS